MNLLKSLIEQFKNKSNVIIIISFLFFIVSILASLIGFEMFVYEDKLLKENFLNNEKMFYLLFIIVNGISFFFFYLSKGLWNLKEWTRYFILGSSFISLIYNIYNICTLFYFIIFTEIKDKNAQTNLLLLNFTYALIYIGLLKYFTLPRVQAFFNKKENLENLDKFYILKK